MSISRAGPRRLRTGVATAALAVFAAGAAQVARADSADSPADSPADSIDEIGQSLIGLEAEARALGQALERPGHLGQLHHTEEGERRLVSARVAFRSGDYDHAALLLYDIVEEHPDSPGYDTALYYLGESLFRKGDHVAARTYFTEIAEQRGSASRFYVRALRRLVELSLELDDDDADPWLEALSDLSDDDRGDVVPYAQGRHAYFSEDYSAAIEHFQEIQPGAERYLQAQYFIAASYVALGQLPTAADVLTDLVDREPTTANEARVIELGHLALARIHYERDEPIQAIDRYLEVSRHSDRFDDTLYEAAWVYVRNDQFERALRALELLGLTDPSSARMPEVRILEGNLRIRRAQQLADIGERGNSAEQYARATRIFESTKRTYEDAHEEIESAVRDDDDPLRFFGQVTGHVSDHDADHDADLPEPDARLSEIAVAWLREEADVGTLVAIGEELSAVRAEIETAELSAARVEGAVRGENRANVFPKLAQKRARATEATERVLAMRADLSARQQEIADEAGVSGSRLRELRDERRAIAREIAELPDADAPYGERRARARERYDDIDAEASRVRALVRSAEAELTALVAYIEDHGMPDADPEDVAEIRERIAAEERTIEQLRSELRALRREATLARDRAGNERERRARELHEELRASIDAEHRALAQIGGRIGEDGQTEWRQIASLHDRAGSILGELEGVTSQVDELASALLVDVQDELAEQVAELEIHREELAAYEAAAREVGAEVLRGGMLAVLEEFGDILIRADVGVVDVAWAKKEELDARERSLTLERARELRTLDSQFREVIEADRAREAEDRAREAEDRAREAEEAASDAGGDAS